MMQVMKLVDLDDEYVMMARREVSLLRKLHHENILEAAEHFEVCIQM